MIAKQSNKCSILFPVYHHLGISVPAHSPAAAHMRIKNAPPETPITNQRSACDWERRSKGADGWPFAKQKAEAKQTLLRRGGGWIRFSAEKPRRWKRATGAFSLRSAPWRVRIPPPPPYLLVRDSKQKSPHSRELSQPKWRRRRDSNPRDLIQAKRFSRPPHSTTLPPLRVG